jgi:hypothetical protein
VNGPPAKPISGVGPSSATSAVTASVMKSTSPGSSGRSRARSLSPRIGSAITGPTPGLMSISRPTARNGTTMSLNRMAASTGYRRSGWRVISVITSGRKQALSIGIPPRARRYSGSERPAWRMYQTGVYGTGCRRQASRNGDSSRGLGCTFTSAMLSQDEG